MVSINRWFLCHGQIRLPGASMAMMAMVTCLFFSTAMAPSTATLALLYPPAAFRLACAKALGRVRHCRRCRRATRRTRRKGRHLRPLHPLSRRRHQSCRRRLWRPHPFSNLWVQAPVQMDSFHFSRHPWPQWRLRPRCATILRLRWDTFGIPGILSTSLILPQVATRAMDTLS